MTTPSLKVNILMILDGWGINENTIGNAVAQADTPFLEALLAGYPNCRLQCSGNAVGLPDGTMGNSEVGHTNIGAGRKVLQDFVRINTAIADESFFKVPELTSIMETVRLAGRSIHFMGLLSDGGVHSHITHLFALIRMAKDAGIKNVFIHPIMDGRDTSPTSGVNYMTRLCNYLKETGCGKVASVVGRYWAMDRDTRWDRVEKAYRLFTLGEGRVETDPVNAVKHAYDKDQTDEFIKPVFIENSGAGPKGIIEDGDGVVFFNFRADRAKEITRAFMQEDFTEFTRERRPKPAGYVCMTRYDEHFGLPAAFGPQQLKNILGEVFSRENIRQLRIAETEKYAHVTYFFNGGDENVFKGEQRVLIPSPRDVATYDLKPEMSAFEVAQKACDIIRSGETDFIILNFANMDMVGHSGILPAAIKACEAVDNCVRQVVEAIWETGGFALITADHGNSEQMLADDGSPHTAHTLNPVRLILAGQDHKKAVLKDGILGDIAPTVLKLLNIAPPDEMTGTSLL